MTARDSWNKSYSREIDAKPELIWRLFADVSTWKAWNAGVGSIKIEGEFAAGTWFSMTLPGDDVLRTRLMEVSAPRHFVDETWIGETVVRVDHRIEPLSGSRCRVTFSAQVEGPEATSVGEGATADFPDVLVGLALHAGSLSHPV